MVFSSPKGMEISSLEEALAVVNQLTLPLIVRSSFTLGERESGFITTYLEFESVIVIKQLNASPMNGAFLKNPFVDGGIRTKGH